MDMDQLSQLYDQHGKSVLRYLHRLVGKQLAEDLLQDTFVQVLRKPHRLSRAESPRAWLLGVARYVALTALRKRRLTVALTTEPPVREKPAEDFRLAIMRRAITQLPDEQREPLALRLEEQLSYAEIANVLDVPLGTVRSRIHYAVRKLRILIESERVRRMR